MEKYIENNRFGKADYDVLQSAIEKCDDAEQLSNIAAKMFSSDYISMPPELGIKILRRYLAVSNHKAKAKAFLGQWLFYYGMEYENDEEGVRLLESVEPPALRESPWQS